jgi:hypothetical protein
MPTDIFENNLTPTEQSVAEYIWQNKDQFFCWPVIPLLLLPEVTRPGRGHHSYSDELRETFGKFKIPIDSKSNGPAVMSYLLSGGEMRFTSHDKLWEIHHIYNRDFSFNGEILDAVHCGNHFTDSAGLVAAHPVAHKAAHTFAYIARRLWQEANERYEYNPLNFPAQH